MEWKLEDDRQIQRLHVALKPSLVEWKQLEGPDALDSTLHLETFLSGMETGLPVDDRHRRGGP